MSIVTGVVSLAKPVKDGVVSFDSGVGWFSLTVGAAVSTVNVTASLAPFSSARLVCVACAVYTPSARVSLGPTDHVPSAGGKRVVSVCSGSPVPTVVPA